MYPIHTDPNLEEIYQIVSRYILNKYPSHSEFLSEKIKTEDFQLIFKSHIYYHFGKSSLSIQPHNFVYENLKVIDFILPTIFYKYENKDWPLRLRILEEQKREREIAEEKIKYARRKAIARLLRPHKKYIKKEIAKEEKLNQIKKTALEKKLEMERVRESSRKLIEAIEEKKYKKFYQKYLVSEERNRIFTHVALSQPENYWMDPGHIVKRKKPNLSWYDSHRFQGVYYKPYWGIWKSDYF